MWISVGNCGSDCPGACALIGKAQSIGQILRSDPYKLCWFTLLVPARREMLEESATFV
jgi:hypothetical protein